MKISELLCDLVTEIESEKVQSMTTEERTYHAIAQKLLVLERDLRAPGSAKSEDERIERVLEAIEREDF